MKLSLKNVGKIKEADIELNGITVIGGENNTGKSTIGKMLYCVFHSFYRIEDQILDERKKTINRVLINFYRETSNRYMYRFNTGEIIEDILENREFYLKDLKSLENKLADFYNAADERFSQSSDSISFNELAIKIADYLNITDDEIRKVILSKRLEAEFAMKVGHVNDKNHNAEVDLKIKDKSITFDVGANGDINIKNYLSLVKEIIYIDDPFVLDDLEDIHTYPFYNSFLHRLDLMRKLIIKDGAEDFGVVDELLVKNKLDTIFKTMNDVCDGEIVSTDDNRGFVYKTDKLDSTLDMVNLSTGMKSFVMLRTLLKNGRIDENGIIILDEPEIHLHPEWQLKFAEIIVLIQREFKTNILLNTHSPYFLNAIEVYSTKYGIEKNCKYYLTEDSDGRTAVMDVTDDKEHIYQKLARPLQKLQNMEYENGITG